VRKASKRYTIISCGTVTAQEDKINISIEGLTKKEKFMLQIMWSIDSKEQLNYWINSLTEKDRKTAASLLLLIQYEVLESLIEDDYSEAKEVLSKFTSLE
jgi:hypothetical protein